jgi:multiple sugar transport system permease protein
MAAYIRIFGRKIMLWQVGVIALLAVMAIVSLLPLYWMIVTAFSKPELVLEFPPKIVPMPPTMENFIAVAKLKNLMRWLLNTAIISVSVTAGGVFLASMAGYSLAKKKFPGNRIILWIYIGSMMIPMQVTLVPLYILVQKMKMIDTYWALILPFLGTPWAVFMVKQFMASLPSELIESARIDGCSEWGIFGKIIFPLAIQGLTVLIVITFVTQWNSFLWVLIATNSVEMRNIQAGLSYFQELYPMRYSDIMAASTLAAIPMFIVFFSFQKYFLKGITVGALKG